jgi:TP901 family phage tail tape measure protein
MSDRLDVAFVEIEPDFSTFNRNVERGVRSGMRSLEREVTDAVGDVEDAFEDLGRDIADSIDDATNEITRHVNITAEGMTTTFTNAAGELVDEFGRAIDKTSQEFRGLEQDASKAFDDVAAKARATGREIDDSLKESSSSGGDSIKDSADRGSDALGGLGGVADRVGLDIRGSMKGAAGAAGIGLIVAAAAAAAQEFVEMGREALDLEGDIIRVAQATDSGFSPAAVDEYRGALLDLQSEYGVLTDDLVPALRTAVAQGVPEDNVISFLETATQSAIVSGSDLNDTVSVINGLMSQFEGEFSDAGAAADFLTVTLSNTNAEVSDVGDVFGEVSGFARDAGLGVDQISAAFAAMSITGRDAGTSGGQLAALIEELGDSTTPVAEAFNELTGRSFQQFIAEGGNIQQAAQIIADGADDAGQSVVELAGSAETSSAILALSTEAGAERYAEALADVDDATGNTAESFGEIEESGALAFGQLEGSLATLRDEAGAAVAPLVAEFVDGLIPVLEELSPIIQGVGQLLLTAFSVAMEFLSPLLDLVLGLFEAMSPLLEALSPLFEILSLIAGIVGDVLAPVFNLLFAILGPIFELVGALLTPALEMLKLLFEGLGFVIDTLVAPAIEWLAGQMEGWLGPVVKWVSGLLNANLTAFKLLIGWVQSNWGRITSTIGAGVSAVGGFFADLWDDVKGVINRIIDGWNSLTFTVPSVDLGPLGTVGGFSISTPNIPRLETGGFTTAEGLAQLHPDEMVLPLSHQNGINALAAALESAGAVAGGESGPIQLTVQIGSETITQMVDTQITRNNKTLTRRARVGTGRG